MLFLDRRDVAELLPMPLCIAAVERAFADHARGLLPAAPGVLGTQVDAGGFHVKTAAGGGGRACYAAKVNANFPGNPARHGLPAIQGMIALFDATNGRPLALLDSIEITILRTAAASAIAARLLARPAARNLLVCGCGTQGRAHVRALALVRPLHRVLAFDQDPERAREFAARVSAEHGVAAEPVLDLAAALTRSDMVVTCTPSRAAFVSVEDIRPGQFIAAVGADSEGKQELDPRILGASRVVADIAAQAAQMGELQHALAAGVMKPADLHAELGEIIAGMKPGRSTEDQVFVFDSTGTALQDVAAAALVHERAIASRRGREFDLSGESA